MSIPYVATDAGILVRPNGHAVSAELRRAELTIQMQEASIRDLELQLAERQWLRLGEDGTQQFSRRTIGEIVAWARAAYLKNPMVNRAVEIGALYVWGQDVTRSAANEDVSAFLDAFWADNATTLTGQQISRALEVELQITSNVFLAFIPDHPELGKLAVRHVPMEQISDIVTDPEDDATVWYYRRDWTQKAVDGTVTKRSAFHPDWRYDPADKPPALRIADGQDVPIRWDAPMSHTKVGAFAHWRWGVPEVYPALDWAKTYSDTLSDDASRSASLKQFAWKATTGGGAAGVAAGKTRFGTTLSTSATETNPARVAGAVHIRDSAAQDLEPIKIAGANLDPEHARPIRLYAAAGLGIPDHFFDADVGNHATASTLDRPTELRFAERRAVWIDLLTTIVRYAIAHDLSSPAGSLPKGLSEDELAFTLSFPDLLEADVTQRVSAIVAAATLNGQVPAGTIPAEDLSRMLLAALNVEDVDAILDKLTQAQQAQEALREAGKARIVTIGEDELADAAAWFDARFEALKGALG